MIRNFCAAAACVWLAVGLALPEPEPTFRQEYRFFESHLGRVPNGCVVVYPRWGVDLGLYPPHRLSELRGLELVWMAGPPAPDLDTDRLVYWRPAACSAATPTRRNGRTDVLPDCLAIETRYRLEPIAETRLEARPGFVESYASDTVPVGFYRLYPRP